MATAERTQDHQQIRKWVEERGGRPAQVAGTGGLLRIDFPDNDPDERLEPISWEEFFRIFDESQITFLYDPEANSRFNKFVQEEAGERRSR